jgi:hypothetical protein
MAGFRETVATLGAEFRALQNPFFWLTSLAVVAALALICAHPFAINPDAALFFQAGQLLLEGQRPYVDLVELNPPLAMYLNVLPAAAARALPLPAPAAFNLFIWLVSLAWIIASWRALRLAVGPTDAVYADALTLTLAAFGLALVWQDAYGQREQLFVLGYLPFLALRVARWLDQRPPLGFSVAIGAACGLVACVKPHFLFVAAAVELFWLIAQRRWRLLFAPEMLALGAIGVAYAGHFLLLPAEVRREFFGRWLPLVAKGYPAYASPFSVVLKYGGAWQGPLAAVCAFCLAPRLTRAAAALAKSLGVAAAAGTVAYLQQQKGWLCQDYTALFASAGVLALLLTWAVERRLLPRLAANGAPPLPRLGRGLTALAALLTLSAAALAIKWGAAINDPRHFAQLVKESPAAAWIARASARGEPILVVSTSVGDAYPLLVQLDRRPGSRFLWFFPLAFFRYLHAPAASLEEARSLDQLPPDERRFWADLGEDLHTRRPRLIFVVKARGSLGCPFDFRVSSYLEAIGFVDRYMKGYRPLGVVFPYAVYQAIEPAAPPNATAVPAT